jgi:hypothetical protein
LRPSRVNECSVTPSVFSRARRISSGELIQNVLVWYVSKMRLTICRYIIPRYYSVYVVQEAMETISFNSENALWFDLQAREMFQFDLTTVKILLDDWISP